ncbi:hypothetical protein WAI453_000118 [Rhynchosporium graminicola]
MQGSKTSSSGQPAGSLNGPSQASLTLAFFHTASKGGLFRTSFLHSILKSTTLYNNFIKNCISLADYSANSIPTLLYSRQYINNKASSKKTTFLPKQWIPTDLLPLLADATTRNIQTGHTNAKLICGDASHQARDCPTRGPAKCYNCGGEGHMSRECPDGPKDKTCYKCGQPGHISRDCQNPAAEGAGRGGGGFQSGGGSQECYKCSKIGHIARNCPEAGGYGGNQGGFGGNQGYGGRGGYGGGAGGQGGQTCYSCGGYGHMSRDCTQGQKCYNCGEVGHLSRDCPVENNNERTCYKCKQPGHVQAQCPN